MKPFLLIVLVPLIVTLVSCKPDKQDICDNANPLSADFYMQEDPQDTYFKDIELYDTDTAGWLTVKFTAKQAPDDGVTYSWKTGTDPQRRTTRSVTLLFGDFYNQGGRSIDIWLTVRKPPSECFPDDTIATFVRKLHFKAGTYIKGTYEGFFKHDPNTLRRVYINPDTMVTDSLSGFPYTGLYLDGLPVFSPITPKNTDFERILRLRRLNVKAGSSSSSNGEKGHFWINFSLENDNQTLHIETEALDRKYADWKVGDPIIKTRYWFTGKRVN